MKNIEDYQKQKSYLVCVDSDGCAMDTMDIKHITCFGPCMIEEWSLQQWQDDILNRWNEMNLYTITRGINRFKGLARMLREVHEKYVPIQDIEVLEGWVEESDELSNEALQKVLRFKESIVLQKALAWSKHVNIKIGTIPDSEKKPFEGVKEGLSYAHKYADVVIVSSANLQAVLEEWELYGLLDHVDLVLAQNTGSKDYCIAELLKKGYAKESVLMIGDALGDLEAAKKNETCYYPILVRHEKESWNEFREKALEKLIEGSYTGEYQEKKEALFLKNLSSRKDSEAAKPSCGAE